MSTPAEVRSESDSQSQVPPPPSSTGIPASRRFRSRRPGWTRSIPYFLSASLFLSGFLAFLAPFPFLYLLYLGLGTEPAPGIRTPGARLQVSLAALTNSTLVYLASGQIESVLVFLWLAFLPAIFLPLLLERLQNIDKTVVAMWGLLTGSVVAVWLGASHLAGISPFQVLDQTLGVALKGWMDALTPDARQAVLGDIEFAEWKRSVFRELPSGVGIFCLLISAFNVQTLLRWNPAGLQRKLRLSPDFSRRWKAPEWLIWPSIAALAANLWGPGVVGLIGENAVRLLMAVYAFQGLSILAFVLDLWRVRGWFRFLIYGFIFMTMLPLVIALGFFDTWFDFRKKLRQT